MIYIKRKQTFFIGFKIQKHAPQADRRKMKMCLGIDAILPQPRCQNGLPGMLKNLANLLKYSRICKQVPRWSKIREFCICLTHSNFLLNSL